MTPLLIALAAMSQPTTQILPEHAISQAQFGNDSAWYESNIPFFECSDKQIEDVYYYRWKLFKAHIRDVGERGIVITEFLDDVPWQKWPFASLNDASPFHIREARWLKDPSPGNGYIDYLFNGGGNDRHFSEAISDATYQYFLARGDLKFVAKYLPTMQHIYNLWDDHFDFSKGLYWIEPLLDATEYTISSIDATGGRDGFTGGQAFRPTINAYQYGNALAISRFASLTGDHSTARSFSDRARLLKEAVQKNLWSDSLAHFRDRIQVTNSHVHYWDPIRGRELAGYLPWTYGLPDDRPEYAASWAHALSPEEFGGRYGLRTVEPSYQYYMRQYRYLGTQPECQWNGPSWPFQTTQFLTGLANVLNDYHQTVATQADYLRLLRQYAAQHYLDGELNLQEDYNPDTGHPIVGLDRSHHYNHSGYVDLIVTGLCGLRPREDGRLIVNPLISSADEMRYFCLENLPYHGHRLTIAWDSDGTRYHRGAGLSVYVDGKRVGERATLGKLEATCGPVRAERESHPVDLALNIARQGFPLVSSSVPEDKTAWEAVDGRTWFFPEMVRGWSTKGSLSSTDWLGVDFGRQVGVSSVRMQFYQGPGEFVPETVKLEGWIDGDWKTLATVKPVANGPTKATFPRVDTSRLRLEIFHRQDARLVEFAAFGDG